LISSLRELRVFGRFIGISMDRVGVATIEIGPSPRLYHARSDFTIA